MADGRSMKYLGLVNPCAASREPIVTPSRLIRLPCAWLGKATDAKPVITTGYSSPKKSVITTTATAEPPMTRIISASTPRRSGRA